MWGMIFGSAFAPLIADRVGPKKVMVVGVFLYTVLTGVTGYASTQMQFMILRILSGVALAGVLPCIVSLVTEYSPYKERSLLSTAINSGVPIGSMLAALFGTLLLPTYTWRILFWLSFVMMFVVIIVVLFVPESMHYLVKHGKKQKISKALRRLDPNVALDEDDEYVVDKKEGERSPVTALFTKGFAKNTLLFWFTIFMNLFTMFGLSTWIPSLMIRLGYPLGSSLMLLFTLQLGAVFGIVVGGLFANKHGFKKVLVVGYLLTGSMITSLALVPMAYSALLYVAIFLAGAGLNGCQSMAVSYISQSHPSTFRTTALGLSLGCGRLGGALAPSIGGLLIAAQIPVFINFLVFALPSMFAMVAIINTSDRVQDFRDGDEAPAMTH
jgi:AAHS family benzoate transporter-like MFS transporter